MIKARQIKAIVDREQYLKTYAVTKDTVTVFKSDIMQPYELVKGVPLIINIEGTYVKADELPNIICYHNDKGAVVKYVACMHQAAYPLERLVFRWRRN